MGAMDHAGGAQPELAAVAARAVVLRAAVEGRHGARRLRAALAVLGPILVMATFPETRGRTLEEIAPER